MRSTTRLPFALVAALFAGASAGAAPQPNFPAKALDPKANAAEIYEGKSADGLLYLWRAPKHYDASKGVGVTFILHGSGSNRGWGFANHSKESFRLDDLVISPDGTSSNGEFMGDPKDAKRLHALLEEVKKAFKVRGVY